MPTERSARPTSAATQPPLEALTVCADEVVSWLRALRSPSRPWSVASRACMNARHSGGAAPASHRFPWLRPRFGCGGNLRGADLSGKHIGESLFQRFAARHVVCARLSARRGQSLEAGVEHRDLVREAISFVRFR